MPNSQSLSPQFCLSRLRFSCTTSISARSPSDSPPLAVDEDDELAFGLEEDPPAEPPADAPADPADAEAAPAAGRRRLPSTALVAAAPTARAH